MHTLRRARTLYPKSRVLSQYAIRHVSSSPAEESKPISSILIANRGEIALRVNRTASNRGIRVTTLYTEPDSHAPHAHASSRSVNLGSTPSAYLDAERIVKAALETGSEAIHPGYGFLSENAAFARRCTEAGIKFLGPPWEAIEAMGDKSRSKEIMTKAGVPCIPGYHGENQDPEFLKSEAAGIGYPVLIIAVKGGGGKGMRIVQGEDDFLAQLDSAKTESRNAFGDDAVLVENYLGRPRHISVHVFCG
jgi:3-methylcrotonyl-CoA carboxylase alpha subunit